MAHAVYRVVIDGEDITSKLNPILLRLTVSDKEGSASDTASLDLDDTDGHLILPPDGVEMAVFFGWEEDGDPPLRFVGTVDEPRSSGGRGSGAALSISAKGINTKANEKEEKLRSWDDKTLEDVVKEAGKEAGFSSVKVDPDLAKLKRAYWHQSSESFLQFGQRLAEEVGGTFKIQGKAVTISKRGAGRSASGKPLPTISAKHGVNLHSWDLSPTTGRRRFKKVRARYYDPKEATLKDVEVEVENDDTPATKTIRKPAASKDEAQAQAEAGSAESERERGGGSVTIEGNGDAQPEGTCVVSCRPGVDGTYTISDVEHSLDRGGGWTTTLQLKKPGGEAGKDGRAKEKASSKSGSSSSSTGSSSSSSSSVPTPSRSPASMPADDRLSPYGEGRLTGSV